jgi:GTP-binding protein HflX
VPEIVAVNKADAADPVEVKGLQARERNSVVVSARTGAGIGDLLAAVDAALPQRDQEIRALLPYRRGDLVARAHAEGEVLALRHRPEGTELTARVPPSLASQIVSAGQPGVTARAR